MKRITFVVVLASLSFDGRADAQPSTLTASRSVEEVARQLAGMWRLVGNPQRLADGTTREGANTVGYAFFDAAGKHMCFLSMNPNRPRWSADVRPTPEQELAASRGINTYCATLDIHPAEGFMDRIYDINQNPNAVGRPSRRWYSFQGSDRMTLRVDAAELAKPVVETLFVWERVTK